MAVQQTIEFAAAATLSPEPQKGIGASEKQNAQDRDDDDYDDDVDDDTGSSEGSQESQSSIHPKGSADNKKIVTQARFKQIVDRLHNTAEQYQNNRQQRQLQKAQKEAEVAMRAKPTMNKRSAQIARNIEPLAVRTEKRKALLEKNQENVRLKRAEQEMEQIKACPKINPKSQEICSEVRSHGINSQYQWDKERRQRLEAEQEQRREEELKDCTFKPQLSAMSEKLSSGRNQFGRDVHARLHRQASEGRRGNRQNEAAHSAANGGYPSDLERAHAPTQGTSNAIPFEAFIGEQPTSVASATPRSAVHLEEQMPTPPQVTPRLEALAAPKRRPNPLTKGMTSLQEERRRRQEAERRREEEAELVQRQIAEELQWEDEQEAVNRTVRHIQHLDEYRWENDERAEHPFMTPRHCLRRHDNEWNEPEEEDFPPSSERHSATAMSFESFMMGASLGFQLEREQLPPQSPYMDEGRPLSSTSSFLPADVGYGMGCAAELNVVKYDDKFLDIFNAIAGEA